MSDIESAVQLGTIIDIMHEVGVSKLEYIALKNGVELVATSDDGSIQRYKFEYETTKPTKTENKD